MSVIQVKGNVTYPITIDPSVWIFDDRKFSFDRKGTVKTHIYNQPGMNPTLIRNASSERGESRRLH